LNSSGLNPASLAIAPIVQALIGSCRGMVRRTCPLDIMPRVAIRHYEVGLRIGELSLGPGFNGLLPWGLIDNRPFLRCMQSFGLCLWRLGRLDEAQRTFERMLWLNPADNQGIRFLTRDLKDGRPWQNRTEW
jgi:hypothetical protein